MNSKLLHTQLLRIPIARVVIEVVRSDIYEKISIEELKAGSRHKKASRVRARITIGLVKTHGVALAEVARRVGLSTSAISKIIKRGRQ